MHYSALAASQQLKERQALSLVAMALRLNAAMEELAVERGIAMSEANPGTLAKLLEAVVIEFNQHGIVGVSDRYKLNRHNQTAMEHMLIHCCPEALREIQGILNFMPERKSPFRVMVLESSRWLLGSGGKGAGNDIWSAMLTMDRVKQTLMMQIIAFEVSQSELAPPPQVSLELPSSWCCSCVSSRSSFFLFLFPDRSFSRTSQGLQCLFFLQLWPVCDIHSELLPLLY